MNSAKSHELSRIAWERLHPPEREAFGGEPPVPLYRSTRVSCAGRLRPRLNPDTAEGGGRERCDSCGARFDRGRYVGGHGEAFAVSGLAGFTLDRCPCPVDHVEVEHGR